MSCIEKTCCGPASPASLLLLLLLLLCRLLTSMNDAA
jgi:hypothetical protein